MKRIGYLFDKVIDPENLRLAFLKASRGKCQRADQRRFRDNLGTEICRLRDGLISGKYPIGDFKRFTIFDPKEREICAASFGERVLQHALMNVCEPYFDKWLVYDSYACRVGKGQVAAVKRAREYAHRHKWFMKCDFRKCFDSIPHDRLKAALARRFKDSFVLGWFCRIIDSYEKSAGRGLPIGSLTSQHFANFYLDPLDRFVAVAGRPPYQKRIDYREVLDEATFARFAKLRERRKAIAQEDGVPPYMVMTDAQMAEAVKDGEPKPETLKKIEGFGEARFAKYAERLCQNEQGGSGNAPE